MLNLDNEYIRVIGEPVQKCVETCASCGELLYVGETVYKDADYNYFCSEFCADEFHQIEEVIL